MRESRAVGMVVGLGCALAVGLSGPSAGESLPDVPRGVASWPARRGHHRARVRVGARADAVRVRIPWRRRDRSPERKAIDVVAEATDEPVRNVVRVAVVRAFGDIVFQPAAGPGLYDVYYMRGEIRGSRSFPNAVYPPPEDRADPAWVRRHGLTPEARAAGRWRALPRAEVVAIEARGAFHRFDPMEVIATEAELRALVAAHPEPYLLFPEDREHPIRMTDDLPLRWIRRGPGASFRGEALRGEFYTFQIGVYAARAPIRDLAVEFAELRPEAGGRAIPASAIRCFNLGGIDGHGEPFRKRLDVAQGEVQALWFGVEVPRDAAGRYRSRILLRPRGLEARGVDVVLDVGPEVLEDHGDGDPRRLSRLRWLDSRIAVDDEVAAPYTPLEVRGLRVACLGRRVEFGEAGLPARIVSRFAPTVDAIRAGERDILAAPMAFAVRTAGGPVRWRLRGSRIVKEAAGAWVREAESGGGPFALTCRAAMEFDGHIDIALRLEAERAVDVEAIRLDVPLRRDVARHMMGMGRKGGLRPASWTWQWDRRLHQDSLWLGDVNAGLRVRFKGPEYTWPLVNIHYRHGPLRIPEAWDNGGRGRVTVSEVGGGIVRIRASTGPRHLEEGEVLRFGLDLLVTPVKPIDPKAHWATRYYHAVAPPEKILAAGANVAIIHHGNALNPFINYPFLAADRLAAYVREAHAKGLRVKIYYTLRELSSRIAELWAVRSLDHEVFADGPGGGCAWLQEHLGAGYVRAWHHWFPDGTVDAALVTAALSRWHNYYLEGLAWLLRHVEIDGLYLDDIGYDRTVMRRARKILDRLRPGSLIDLHSWNHFNARAGFASCANLYMEHFPYVDGLWFGEGFDYDESPDYWLVEISGIPFGLMGEMLQGGGNPWRGMVFGMTGRLPWSGDPRPIWKVWDAFGIAGARMIGYWVPGGPVRTGREDVLATAYVRPDRTLVALASWGPEPVPCRLEIDWEALGLDPGKATIRAPAIRGFQPARAFDPRDAIRVEPGRGWLLILEPRA